MISAQVESFMEAWPELEPWLPIHYAELALYQDRIPLDVDLSRYAAWEADGSLMFVTVRDAGRLVGYFVGLVGTSPHYQSTLSAKADVIYLDPEHRGFGTGRLLMDTIMAEMRRRGVRVVWMGSKNHKPIEALFVACGFEPAETYFSQWIGD